MGPESRRILIATVASVAVLFVWQTFFAPKPTPPGAKGAPVIATAGSTAAPAAPGAPAAVPPAPAVAPVPEAPEELVTLEGKDFTVVLSSHGGAVSSVKLRDQKFQRELDGKTVAIDLVHVTDGQPRPLSLVASPELGGGADPLTDPGARSAMRVVSRDARSVVFEGRVGAASVRKSYRLTSEAYELALEVEVSGAPAAGAVELLFPTYMAPSTNKGGFLSGPALEFSRPVCRAKDKTERFDVLGDDAGKQLEGHPGWAGVEQHYFVSAVFPPPEAQGCRFLRGPEKGAGATLVKLPVDPAGTKAAFLVYAGPKELDKLKHYDRGFDTAMDYGTVTNAFAFFAQILLRVMRWFHGYVANWGVAIILLTLTVKAVLYPLTLKSMKSMAGMRKLQPEIEKLKAKFGEDREGFARAQMALFSQHKVSMTGGCLPMLLQMPVWFALYAALQTSVELYREPFLWIADLSVKDPWFILPVAMGATSFIMQKLSPQPADNTQAKMMLYFFPGFFTIMMLGVPAGLTLYIFMNNLLSILQQQYVNRVIAKGETAPA